MNTGSVVLPHSASNIMGRLTGDSSGRGRSGGTSAVNGQQVEFGKGYRDSRRLVVSLSPVRPL